MIVLLNNCLVQDERILKIGCQSYRQEFIARHHKYRRARYLFTNSLRLSVRLSVWPMPIPCLNEWTYRHIFLTVWQWRHSSLFRRSPPLRVRAIVTIGTGTGSRSIRVDSSDLDWPWKEGREGGQNSMRDLHNYARTVWPRMTEFGMATQMGRSIFL